MLSLFLMNSYDFRLQWNTRRNGPPNPESMRTEESCQITPVTGTHTSDGVTFATCSVHAQNTGSHAFEPPFTHCSRHIIQATRSWNEWKCIPLFWQWFGSRESLLHFVIHGSLVNLKPDSNFRASKSRQTEERFKAALRKSLAAFPNKYSSSCWSMLTIMSFRLTLKAVKPTRLCDFALVKQWQQARVKSNPDTMPQIIGK